MCPTTSPLPLPTVCLSCLCAPTRPACPQVSMRACAREVGVSAIQSASVERSLEEHLAGERKALLAALTGPRGAKSVRDIAAGE
jgi:hypothetical protein